MSNAFIPKFAGFPRIEIFSIRLRLIRKHTDDNTSFEKLFNELRVKMPYLTHLTILTEFLTVGDTILIFQLFPQLKAFRLRIFTDVFNFELERFQLFDKFIEKIIENGKNLNVFEFYSKSYPVSELVRPCWVDKMFKGIESLQQILLAYSEFKKFTRSQTQTFDIYSLDRQIFDSHLL